MIELDTRTRAQRSFDEWADSLPIDGESGQPIVTDHDIDRLLSQASCKPGWRGYVVSCRRKHLMILNRTLRTSVG